MRNLTTLILITLVAALGCGGSQDSSPDDADTAKAQGEMPADAAHGVPDDDVHSAAVSPAVGGATHQGGGINADVSLDPEIADHWKAIRVRVVDLESGADSVHEIAIGDEVVLGSSGLTLRALTFVPDFVMGEGGITTRSAEPQNPAARVVIIEAGKDDYEGWLFGAMPEIHAYPHERYGVVLVEGVPAK